MAKKGPGAIGQTSLSGETVADEICSCGHSIHDHHDNVGARGKGSCSRDGCMCERFTWERFVMENGKHGE